MGRFVITPLVANVVPWLAIGGVIGAATPAEKAAQRAAAAPPTASSNHRDYAAADLPGMTIFGDKGKSRQILAMAAADPQGSKLYVFEALAQPGGGGRGDYQLSTLAPSGQVIRIQLLKNKDDPYDPPVGSTLIPLAEPHPGAIVLGPFGRLSGTHQWRMFHVAPQGVAAAELEGIWDCRDAVLAADKRSLLAVGVNVGLNRMYGMVWNLDFQGRILSKRTYDRRRMEGFNAIVLADDGKGVLIAEESPKEFNKFGVGESSVGFLRCNPDGEVLAETRFPGRRPKVLALGQNRYAVLYDAESSMAAQWRLRVVDLALKPQWEKSLPFDGFGFDDPGWCLTTAGDVVVAGPAGAIPRPGSTSGAPARPRPRLEVIRWDRQGRPLFSASIPSGDDVVKHDICVACSADSIYLAARTRGSLFKDGMHSAVYRLPSSPAR